jgi:hypothetical protein
MNNEGIYPFLCTIPQAAVLIGRGQTFIYGAIGDGTIEAKKSDGRTLVVVESLRRYADGLPAARIKPPIKPISVRDFTSLRTKKRQPRPTTTEVRQ